MVQTRSFANASVCTTGGTIVSKRNPLQDTLLWYNHLFASLEQDWSAAASSWFCLRYLTSAWAFSELLASISTGIAAPGRDFVEIRLEGSSCSLVRDSVWAWDQLCPYPISEYGNVADNGVSSWYTTLEAGSNHGKPDNHNWPDPSMIA